jgi:hypothetical protein
VKSDLERAKADLARWTVTRDRLNLLIAAAESDIDGIERQQAREHGWCSLCETGHKPTRGTR